MFWFSGWASVQLLWGFPGCSSKCWLQVSVRKCSLSPGYRESYPTVLARESKYPIRCLGMARLDVEPLSWHCTVLSFSLRVDPKFLGRSLLLAESSGTRSEAGTLHTAPRPKP